jgi:hypothetical protein
MLEQKFVSPTKPVFPSFRDFSSNSTLCKKSGFGLWMSCSKMRLSQSKYYKVGCTQAAQW